MSPRTPIFDLVADDDTAHREKILFWLRAFILMHVGCRTIMALHDPVVDQPVWLAATGYLLIASCAVGLAPRFGRLATSLAAVLLAIQIVGTMPITANHVFLEFLCLAVLGLLDTSKEEERALAVQALRWVVVLLLFYSGFQKLIYGHYFDGQFLAYATATEERFASFFRHLLPAEELLRLQNLDAARLGDGPYRVDSTLFIALSNFTYVFELGVPVLLVWQRTRRVATVLAIVFVVGVEAGARELLFGALVINLLLLYLPGPWTRRLFPLFGGLYLYLVAAEFELLPMFRYYH